MLPTCNLYYAIYSVFGLLLTSFCCPCPNAEEECYHCLASLVAAKEKVFITQTKLLHEVTWKTVMQIAKKHAVSRIFISCINKQSII